LHEASTSPVALLVGGCDVGVAHATTGEISTVLTIDLERRRNGFGQPPRVSCLPPTASFVGAVG
jgi:hypothetical protein